jgi:hypothetical protein
VSSDEARTEVFESHDRTDVSVAAVPTASAASADSAIDRTDGLGNQSHGRPRQSVARAASAIGRVGGVHGSCGVVYVYSLIDAGRVRTFFTGAVTTVRVGSPTNTYYT